jgi:hypothetical protein
MPLTRSGRVDRIFANTDAIADAVCDAMTGSPHSLRPSAAFEAGLPAFNQLHNSLNGGSAGHGGIDDVPPPLGPLVDPPFDPERLLAP